MAYRLFAALAVATVLLCSCASNPSSPAAVQAQGAYADVGGLRMYYERIGRGPPLVLLHGGLGSNEDFNKQIEDLSKDHAVIAIEQVGHGRTADREGPFSYDRMAEETASLLAQLNVDNADFIGYSDGGIVALLLARRHPKLVRRVVSSGANIRVIPAMRESLLKTQAEELAKKLPASLREPYERLSPDGPGHWVAVVAKARDLWMTPVIMEIADLSAIQNPVLVVSGDRDLIPLEHSMEIFRALPKGQLSVIPGTGHNTFRQAPSILNPMIAAFLRAP